MKINILSALICMCFLFGASPLFGQENDKPLELYPLPAKVDNEELFGSRVMRSATLLATSCKDRRQPVTILIYGQSIVQSQAFTVSLTTQLKAKFPYADITIINKCIGGFGGERLIRTATHDVYPMYPDLIVFHVYGGDKHGELEQLFSNIRKYTTAEVLLMNHHLDNNRETINKTQFSFLRYIANKYNCELVDVSTEWVKYLFDNELKKMDLLRDHVHPNKHGAWLLANLVVKHLRYNALYPSDWSNTVQTAFTKFAYDEGGDNAFTFGNEPWKIIEGVPCGDSPKNSLRFSFHGNRVDIIAGYLKEAVKKGSARIYIDGKPVAETPGLLAITRPNDSPSWPHIMRIGYRKPLIEEDWVLHIDAINADSTIHYFSVKGSKTGFDGSGNTAERFVSKSGRVIIETSDHMFNQIRTTFKQVITPGFEVKWHVAPLYQEIYAAPVADDRTKVYKTTVVKGLKNGPHVLEIIPVGDGIVPIEAIEVHRPPMQ